MLSTKSSRRSGWRRRKAGISGASWWVAKVGIERMRSSPCAVGPPRTVASASSTASTARTAAA